MNLSLSSHLQGRVVALFFGFFIGGIAFNLLGEELHAGALTPFLLPVFVFGGAYLGQLVFGTIVTAACPRCGGEAATAAANPVLYICKACGAETNVLAEMVRAKVAAAAGPGSVQEEKTGPRIGVIFLIVGIGAIGIAVWLGQESIRLVAEGVSTDARVSRVTRDSGRSSNSNETQYTAFVEYKVGNQVRTLQRSWSAKSGSSWTWPDYHQGEQLRVIYLPGEPSRASIDTLPELFFAPIFLTLFGLAFGGIGIAMLVYRRKTGEAADGTMVLDAQPQAQPRADSSSWNFLRFAIGAAILFGGAGAFYYFAIVKPDIERQRIAREEALAREAAAQARIAAAQARAAAAARAEAAAKAAATPVAARAGMSECQLRLLNQRNQYAEKYASFGTPRFFNVRSPAGNDCRKNLYRPSGIESWFRLVRLGSAHWA